MTTDPGSRRNNTGLGHVPALLKIGPKGYIPFQICKTYSFSGRSSLRFFAGNLWNSNGSTVSPAHFLSWAQIRLERLSLWLLSLLQPQSPYVSAVERVMWDVMRGSHSVIMEEHRIHVEWAPLGRRHRTGHFSANFPPREDGHKALSNAAVFVMTL